MKKSLFILSIAAAALWSCSSDNDAAEKQSTKAQAYVSFNIIGAEDAKTRTAGTKEETDLATESTITKALVLLCEPSTGVIKQKVAADNLDQTAAGYETKRLQVETGTFDVYVVANYTAALNTSITTGTTKVSDLKIADYTEDDVKGGIAKDNNFLMFSECDGKDKTAGTSITITESNDYDHPATCDAIVVERLVAKIRSAAATSVDISKINTGTAAPASFISGVSLEGYKLLNGAKNSYVQQRWSANYNAGLVNDLISSPAKTPGDNATTNTEYYNNLQSLRTIVSSATETYTTVKDNYDSYAYYNASTPTGVIYCLENNSNYTDGTGIVDSKMANTTGLIYKWKATVTGSDAKAGTNCFYGYNGYYFATLEAIQTKYPTVFTAKSSTLAAAQSEVATAYNGGTVDQAKMSDFRSKYNIKVYTDGIMYYTHYIKDQNYKNTATTPVNYYAVLRNTIYDLTVTALQGVGTDVPGGWNPDVNPDDNVDTKKVYMLVDVKVKDWKLSTESITLK